MGKGITVGKQVFALAQHAGGPAAVWASDAFSESHSTQQVVQGTALSKPRARSFRVKWAIKLPNGQNLEFESEVSARFLFLTPQLKEGKSVVGTTGSAPRPPAGSVLAGGSAGGGEQSEVEEEEWEDLWTSLYGAVPVDDLVGQGAAGSPTESSSASDGQARTERDEADPLCPHGVRWTPSSAGVCFNPPEMVTEASCSAAIRWGNTLGNDRSALDYFLRLYPREHIAQTIELTTDVLDRNNKHALSEQEYFVFIGCMLICALHPRMSVEECFFNGCATDDDNLFPSPQLGRFMRHYRFKDIRDSLTFATAEDSGSGGLFWGVQPLVDAFNSRRADTVHAGATVRINEAMSQWSGGRDHHHKQTGGCPRVYKMKQPKGIGMMIKNVCDVETGIMLSMEIASSAEEMQRRTEPGMNVGTGFLLRLTQSLKGSGRLVVGDSAFSSVESARMMMSRNGLFYIGAVKGATRGFPKKYFKGLELDHCGFTAATAKVDGVSVRGFCWNEGPRNEKTGVRQRKLFVGTAGTTFEVEQPYQKKIWRNTDDGMTVNCDTRAVKCPEFAMSCFSAANKTDVHNRECHALGLEHRVAKRWQLRFFQTFIGICEVDAYLAFTKFAPHKRRVKHWTFVRMLGRDLLKNTINADGVYNLRRVHLDSDDDGGRNAIPGQHEIQSLRQVHLHSDDDGGRNSIPGQHEIQSLRQVHLHSDDDGGRNAIPGQHEIQSLRQTTWGKLHSQRPEIKLRCRTCGKSCATYCRLCTKIDATSQGIFCQCRQHACFSEHVRQASSPSGPRKRGRWRKKWSQSGK